MANEVQALIKVNDFGKGDINNLKRYLYNNVSLIHMHQVNEFRLDADIKNLNVDELTKYTAEKEADITLIYFDTSVGYAKKCELKHGLLTSKKSILFGMDLEAKIFEKSASIEDGFFYLLYDLIDKNSDEECHTTYIKDVQKQI